MVIKNCWRQIWQIMFIAALFLREGEAGPDQRALLPRDSACTVPSRRFRCWRHGNGAYLSSCEVGPFLASLAFRSRFC